MPNVLVRDLPPEVHRVLVERAAAAGQSLQAYITAELTRLAATPTVADIVRRLEGLEGGRVGFSQAVADLAEARPEG